MIHSDYYPFHKYDTMSGRTTEKSLWHRCVKKKIKTTKLQTQPNTQTWNGSQTVDFMDYWSEVKTVFKEAASVLIC